jgi:hypothetical protein
MSSNDHVSLVFYLVCLGMGALRDRRLVRSNPGGAGARMRSGTYLVAHVVHREKQCRPAQTVSVNCHNGSKCKQAAQSRYEIWVSPIWPQQQRQLVVEGTKNDSFIEVRVGVCHDDDDVINKL